MSKKRYLVGLSGGVDSATTLACLQKAGHIVQPIFMHNWEEDEYCHVEEDLETCRAVCQHLGLTLDSVNFQRSYFNEVFEQALTLFQQGLTPNPDILCNSRIKFNKLADYAKDQGFDCLATGHYAQIAKRDGQYALMQAPDPVKDQTYFLSQLSQSQLAYAHFPLGKYTKAETRQMAQAFNLPNAKRKDSVGICFIGDRKFSTFLQTYLLTRKGPIITQSGQVVGKHHGLFCYTIGQRKGLGIGGIKNSQPSPWYVIDKNIEENTLVVSQNPDDLLKTSATLEPIHWIRAKPPYTQLKAKLRHGPEFIDVILDHSRQQVLFLTPQSAPTPGQHIVFYHEQECLGGAMILKTE